MDVPKYLTAADVTRVARLMQETIHGSLVTWAIYREGSAAEWVRQDFETLLAPYLPAKGRRRTSR